MTLTPPLPLLCYTSGGKDWFADYQPEVKTGADCCAADSISFHYVKEPDMRKLYGYRYACVG